MSLFLAVKASFRVAHEEITKKERILICYIYLIHINKVYHNIITKVHCTFYLSVF